MSTREKRQARGIRRTFEQSLSSKDLFIWQKSTHLVETVYRLSVQLPASEQWGFISQMRRAAVSVSNIAEGYGRHAMGVCHHHLSIWPWFVAGIRNSGSFMSKTRRAQGSRARSLAKRNRA
jgi:hypothetical protein